MGARATSPRAGAVPTRPGRWAHTVLPLGVAAFFAFVSIAMGLTVPRPSEAEPATLPVAPPDVVYACTPDVFAALSRRGRREVVLSGRTTSPIDRGGGEWLVSLVCTDSGVTVVRTDTNLEADGLFTIALEAGDAPHRVTRSCFGCGEQDLAPVQPSPRQRARQLHIVGGGLGVLAVAVFLFAWMRRPFDALREQVGGAGPREVAVLEPPSNDRVRLGEATFSARYVCAEGGALVGRQEAPTASFVRLPAAGVDYREGASGLAVVVGPARVNGLSVRAGEEHVLGHGDLLELPGAPAAVAHFATPGRVLRYLAVDDARARIAGRVPSRWGMARVGLLAVLAASAFVALHLDATGWLEASALLGLAAALMAPFAPPRLALPRATIVSLADLREGTARIALHHEPGTGWRVALDGRHLAWLPELSRLASKRRRALHTAVRAELELLGSLGPAERAAPQRAGETG